MPDIKEVEAYIRKMLARQGRPLPDGRIFVTWNMEDTTTDQRKVQECLNSLVSLGLIQDAVWSSHYAVKTTLSKNDDDLSITVTDSESLIGFAFFPNRIPQISSHITDFFSKYRTPELVH